MDIVLDIITSEEKWSSFLAGVDADIWNRSEDVYFGSYGDSQPMYRGDNMIQREQTIKQYIHTAETLTGEHWEFWG